MKNKDSSSALRTVLLVLLVVAASVGAIVMVEGRKSQDEEDAARKEREEPIQVDPLLLTGNITNASWRGREETGSDEGTEEAFDWSAHDRDDFGGDTAKSERFDATLEETVKPLDGLGIFVGKAEEDEPDEKNKKEK